MNKMKYLVKHPLGEFVIDENGNLLKDKSDSISNEKGNEIFRKNFRKIMRQLGYSDEKLNSKLTEIGIDKSLNIYIERIREWYGLHCPELEHEIKNHEKFVKLILEYGKKENIKDKKLSETVKKSIGIDISEKDEKILQEYSSFINQLYRLKEHLEKYIDNLMKEISPNVRELAGPLLGAKLILLTGGLEKLARKPSSTIQLIGSEKALFRYLKGKGKSPKFGIIYQSPYIQNAPFDKKGKAARLLASKLSIAAKIDYYRKEDRSTELKKQLEQEMKELGCK